MWRLRPIDELVEEFAVDRERCVTPLRANRDRPQVSVEVLSDPCVDLPPGEAGVRPTGEMADAFLRRYDKLRRPFLESGRDLTILRGALAGEASIWETALARLERSGDAIPLAALVEEDPGEVEELAAVFSVTLDPGSQEAGPMLDRTLEEPFAYLVVLAWQGRLGRGERERRASASGRLLRAMTESIAKSAPLYVVCVSDGDGTSQALARECERLRVSIVLSGIAEKEGLVTSTRAGEGPGQPPRSVAVAHCPTFRAGSRSSGMTRVRLDIWKGEAEIAFRRDLGSDRPETAVQVVAPLVSASRVSSSERRLRSRVERLILVGREKAQATGALDDEAKIAAFEQEVADSWSKHGYVALCNEAGDVPLPVTRHTRYHLLLLVREREGGGYDMMLSNHSPLRPSLLSDWNTLLLPAFKDVRALLEHLRDDVLRQAKERAEDIERIAHAKQFEDAVSRMLDDEEKGHGDALWAEELREIASRQIRKVSPTTGAVTEFDYQLVTLMPLIERATAKTGEEDGRERRRQLNDRRRIIEWLDGLDTVVLAGESTRPARELPLEALEAGGSGLRWDPETGMVEDPGAPARRRLRAAAPGAVWFPLHDSEKLWQRCPSIVSRNADVMAWAEAALSAARAKQTQVPPELVLGKYAGTGDYRLKDDIFPFKSEERQEDPEEPCLSTVEALERVGFPDSSDLAGEKAYDGAEIRRVFLCREPVAIAGGAERRAIYVYPAEPGEEFGPEVMERERLGILRPVQRYVLRAGMERAAEINERVLPLLAERGDPWGYLQVRKGAALRWVSVTPPIIEQAWPGDLDDLSKQGLTEFVVCDGNHRIVQGVWNEPKGVMPAVAVVGELRRPYYGRPFGRLEWDATAENELPVSPDIASKYLARKVDWEKDLDDRGRRVLANVHKARWYRRYFRDLESGFGYLGGQGGRWS